MAVATLRSIKNRLVKFRDNRELLNDLKGTVIPNMQAELVVAMREFDPENDGIVCHIEDKEEAAFVQQNEASEFWNQEKIMDWLRNQPKAVQMSVTSRVLDPKKWEAEIANGNLDKKVVQKFKEKGTEPKPFIRWGKPTNKSVR
jgi:hypothetical protein